MDPSMNRESLMRLWQGGLLAWRNIRAWAARVPSKAWVVLGLFLLAAFLMALHTAVAGKTATLHLRVQHGLRSVQMSVWVDGELAYSGQIMGTLHKRFGLIPDSTQRTWSQRVPVVPGEHLVRVRMVSDDGSVAENAISGKFVRDGERDLAVSERHSSVLLSWQTSSSGAAQTSSGWSLGPYASTLFLTVAGSIVSALTGYLIKELPKQIGSHQNATPKP